MQYRVDDRIMEEHEYEAYLSRRWKWIYRAVVVMAALYFLPGLLDSWGLYTWFGWWTEPLALFAWIVFFESVRGKIS